MKKYIAALFGAIALLASGCADYDSDIKYLEQRIDDIEGNRIKSIESQIQNIRASLPRLEQADKDLKDMITALEGTAASLGKSLADNSKNISDVKADLEKSVKELQASDKANKDELIAAINTAKGKILADLEAVKAEIEGKLANIDNAISDLKEKDAELEKRISGLEEYVDKEIKDAKGWAAASFATLTQYGGIVEQIAGINAGISGLKTSLTDLEARLTKKFAEDLDKAVNDLKGEIADEVAGLGERIDKEVADITLTGGQLGSIVALRRMSEGLMGRLNGSFKEVMVINSTLLAAGIGGIISPQVSSLLHNASTVALSMRNGKRYDA